MRREREHSHSHSNTVDVVRCTSYADCRRASSTHSITVLAAYEPHYQLVFCLLNLSDVVGRLTISVVAITMTMVKSNA